MNSPVKEVMSTSALGQENNSDRYHTGVRKCETERHGRNWTGAALFSREDGSNVIRADILTLQAPESELDVAVFTGDSDAEVGVKDCTAWHIPFGSILLVDKRGHVHLLGRKWSISNGTTDIGKEIQGQFEQALESFHGQ